jgi:cytochrome P450
VPADIDLTDPDTFADGPPHDIWDHLRDADPLHWHEPTALTPDSEGFWCLTRYGDVEWAARQPALFSSSTGGDRSGGGTLIEDLPTGFAAGVLLNMTDDPRHHHLRRVVSPSVAPRRLRSIESALAERCDAFLDAAVAAGRCDVLTDIAAELPLQAIASLLGVPQDDRHFLLDWADATLDYHDRNPGETTARVSDASAEMSSYCRRVIDDRRACPSDDLMSAAVAADLPEAAEPGGPLSDLELEMLFHLLVAAGSETTRNSITAGLLALVDQPDDWAALRRDPNLVPGAIEETLRWASSTIYNRRTATAEIELHGRTIRAGDKVVLWWQAANFDPRAFDTPERFDIRRSPNPHLAFGAGSHLCLGANLARLEIRLVLDGLLARVERIELDGPAERTRSNKHAGFRHAPVTLHPVPSAG